MYPNEPRCTLHLRKQAIMLFAVIMLAIVATFAPCIVAREFYQLKRYGLAVTMHLSGLSAFALYIVYGFQTMPDRTRPEVAVIMGVFITFAPIYYGISEQKRVSKIGERRRNMSKSPF